MKITVIGSGAMGCLYSSWLTAENDVTLICHKKETADFINKNGITVNNSDKFYPEAIVSGSHSDKKSDLTIIFVKAYDTKSAIRENPDIIKNSTYIMTLQNGIGNYEIISEYIPESKILIGTSQHNSTLQSTGNIIHGGNGITSIGGISTDKLVLENIKQNFIKCGFDTAVSDNIWEIIWHKLIINAAVNAVTAIYCIPTGRLTEKPFMNICEKIAQESVKTARLCGLKFSYNSIMNDIYSLAERQKNAFTSMYNDIKNGRKTEIDSINGAIFKIAEKNNFHAEFNKYVTDKIHLLETRGI